MTIGGRGVLIGLIVLGVVYICWVLWRIRRLRMRRARENYFDRDPALSAEPKPESPPPPQPKPAEAPISRQAAEWQNAQTQFAQDAFMRGVETELGQLRNEVDVLRGELAALREEMQGQIAQMQGQLRASQPVSPLYTDAMQMAERGHDAATIAERCGIARAEADLVVALVKRQQK